MAASGSPLVRYIAFLASPVRKYPILKTAKRARAFQPARPRTVLPEECPRLPPSPFPTTPHPRSFPTRSEPALQWRQQPVGQGLQPPRWEPPPREQPNERISYG